MLVGKKFFRPFFICPEKNFESGKKIGKKNKIRARDYFKKK
jgi:hypothetical protein